MDWLRDQLAGAWGVMNGRADGLRLLDASFEGFWRSFGAIVLILPMAFVVLLSERALLAADEALPTLTGAGLAVRLLAILLDWISFPLLFGLVARPIGAAGAYVPFIVAINWSSVWVAGFFALPSLLHVLGVLPAGILQIVLLAVLVLALRFAYRVARTALGAPPALAFPIVVVQILVSLVIDLGFARFA